jgi:hypothetical protein
VPYKKGATAATGCGPLASHDVKQPLANLANASPVR